MFLRAALESQESNSCCSIDDNNCVEIPKMQV